MSTCHAAKSVRTSPYLSDRGCQVDVGPRRTQQTLKFVAARRIVLSATQFNFILFADIAHKLIAQYTIIFHVNISNDDLNEYDLQFFVKSFAAGCTRKRKKLNLNTAL